MSEWNSVSIREKLTNAIDELVSKSFDEFNKPKWKSRAKFVEEAVEEKLRKDAKAEVVAK